MRLNQIVILGQISENCRGSQHVKEFCIFSIWYKSCKGKTGVTPLTHICTLSQDVEGPENRSFQPTLFSICSLDFLHSTTICRHASARCRSCLPFLTYFLSMRPNVWIFFLCYFYVVCYFAAFLLFICDNIFFLIFFSVSPNIQNHLFLQYLYTCWHNFIIRQVLLIQPNFIPYILFIYLCCSL